MEMTTLLGLIIGIGGILLGNIIEGGHLSSLAQGAAAVIVFMGTAGAVVVSSKKRDLLQGLSMAKKAFFQQDPKFEQKIKSEIIDCAKTARRESILAIEPKINQMSDPFLQNV